MDKHNVIFVLGPPGCGKGTQCALLEKDLSLYHLSAGELLRREMKRPGSNVKELINDYIKDGKIVPVEITCSLLEKEMNRNSGRRFLIDGFPRNQNNLEGWEKQMSEKAIVTDVLFIDCSEEICIERCLKRGNAESKRTDDNIDSLKKRFQTYLNESIPIIDHYSKKNLIRKIDGSGNEEEVDNHNMKIIFSFYPSFRFLKQLNNNFHNY